MFDFGYGAARPAPRIGGAWASCFPPLPLPLPGLGGGDDDGFGADDDDWAVYKEIVSTAF